MMNVDKASWKRPGRWLLFRRPTFASMAKSKTDELKALRVGKSTLGDVLGAVLKVKPPKSKKAPKRKAKPKK